MATLFHFPNFSLSSNKLHHLHHYHHRQHHLTICASSVRKPRASRKVRSKEDLCNDIREFLTAVGLPQDHVPSMKELSQHGRQDLANIVRRRGYKVIRELLSTSTKMDSDGSDLEEAQLKNRTQPVILKMNQQDEKVKDLAEDVSLTSEVSIVEGYLNNLNGANIEHALNSDEENCMSLESSTNSSLQEKVAKFIQNGELDTVEDNSFGILNDIGGEESKGYIESENMREFESSSLSDEHSDKLVGRSYAAKVFDGSTLTSRKVNDPASRNDSPEDDYIPSEGLSAENDEDLDVESRKRESQIEINHLKFMLHQKELELSRLKEKIEKEKLALSVLQTKAETEISKAQKLISEKDAELHAAEESLSGLEEVQIQYWGDGETVEVAGSFNGWHHRIKMDPQPSSSVLDPIGSRKSRLWTTALWLYPGTYEIKFIVDGHWRLDPQRESVSRGTVQNNILQVDR